MPREPAFTAALRPLPEAGVAPLLLAAAALPPGLPAQPAPPTTPPAPKRPPSRAAQGPAARISPAPAPSLFPLRRASPACTLCLHRTNTSLARPSSPLASRRAPRSPCLPAARPLLGCSLPAGPPPLPTSLAPRIRACRRYQIPPSALAAQRPGDDGLQLLALLGALLARCGRHLHPCQRPHGCGGESFLDHGTPSTLPHARPCLATASRVLRRIPHAIRIAFASHVITVWRLSPFTFAGPPAAPIRPSEAVHHAGTRTASAERRAYRRRTG